MAHKTTSRITNSFSGENCSSDSSELRVEGPRKKLLCLRIREQGKISQCFLIFSNANADLAQVFSLSSGPPAWRIVPPHMLLGMSSHVNKTLLHLQKNKVFGEIRNLETSLPGFCWWQKVTEKWCECRTLFTKHKIHGRGKNNQLICPLPPIYLLKLPVVRILARLDCFKWPLYYKVITASEVFGSFFYIQKTTRDFHAVMIKLIMI